MQRVEADVLERFAVRLIEAVGAPEETATQLASSLVRSELRGHGSHGLLQLSSYVRRIEEHDWVDPTAEPAVVRESESAAIVDGRNNFGQVTGRTAVDVGVSKAQQTGFATVGLRNAAHLGRIGEWAERASERGMLFAAFVSSTGTSRLWVAPPGSAQRRLSTNPIAFGVPTFGAREFPIVLDMATSQVAVGKLRECERKGQPVPEEWTVTESGEHVSDPADFFDDGDGAVRPLGGEVSGYKGYGLSIIAELFAGILADDAVSGQPGPELTRNIGAFWFVDPTWFTSVEAIEARVDAFSDHLRSTEFADEIDRGPAAQPGDGMLPGEPDFQTSVERRELGVPLPDGTVDALAELAVRYDCEDAIPEALSE